MKKEIIEIGEKLEKNYEIIFMDETKEKISKLYCDVNDKLVESDKQLVSIKTGNEALYVISGIFGVMFTLGALVTKELIFLYPVIASLVISAVHKFGDIIDEKIELKNNNHLRELNTYILEIEDDLDSHFYESYVLTDYFKDEDYSLKRVKQMNEYLSKFDKDKPNSCFNEVGMKYNYVPYQMIEENKNIMIEDKKNKKDEVEDLSVTDTNLVDIPLESSITNNRGSVTNLDLKPSVFDKDKKVINKNNDYDHIEISIGKVKILTIDKRK